MSDRAECVRRLAELAGVVPRARRIFDWAIIEDDLGMRLPADYKLLAESFPEGWFRLFARIRLPERPEAGGQRLLSEYAVTELDYLRESRAKGVSPFPYPVFPEPGGVLPWGSIRSPGLAYWLTGPGDPDDWPVIAATEDGDYWDRFDGPVCEFLAEVAACRYDASGFRDLYQENGEDWISLRTRPVFTPDPAPRAPVQAVPDVRIEDFWPLLMRTSEGYRPVNEMAVLRELLGAPSAEVPQVDWTGVQDRLGFGLPADYREFIDTYGAGTLGDIRIMAPGASDEMDLFALLDRKYRQISDVIRDPGMVDPPFYPDPGGTVSWGETVNGQTCAWAPARADPDEWTVVIIAPAPRMAGFRHTAGLSFSTMLKDHIQQNPLRTLLIRDPSAGPVTFTPYSGTPDIL
jgi:hypothetical protein